MSNQSRAPSSRSRFQSASYSYSSLSVNGNTMSRSEATYSDPSGTRVYRKSHGIGEAPREERLEYDSSGRQVEDVGARPGAIESGPRIEDVTEENEQQRERDRAYEERIEEEYAKREGGA